MEDEKRIQANKLPGSTPPSRPSAYHMLTRQSKKMGVVATKAFGDLKQLLNYEIHLPPAAEQLLGTRPRRPHATDLQAYNDVANLKETVKKTHEVLASVQTVAIFPDKVIVDRTKITIIKRSFFWSADVISIQIEDILNVSSSVGPLFGSLTIASRVMSTTDHFQINFLWRRDAMYLKRIIQGYVSARQNHIAVDQLEGEELLEMLHELGHDSGM
jgi:hypothetical protein